MNNINIKRLVKDIKDITNNPIENIYYRHDDTNMLKGYAMVYGPSDTIYRYGAYLFEFNFPTDYPYSPPKLKYLTNDGITRFHPNLYRSGKVCISILNTWKGEQWTSCQTIRSVLLMLVTLFHNKPLLNEPGVKETSSSFIPYNKIITYKNLQVSILGNLIETSKYNSILNTLLMYYKKFIYENKDEILKYIDSVKQPNETFVTRIYSMRILVDYDKLIDKFNQVFNKIK